MSESRTQRMTPLPVVPILPGGEAVVPLPWERQDQLATGERPGRGAVTQGGAAADSWAVHGNKQSHLPKRIGPYEILQELGRGGMGVVYLARDDRLGRLVALKMVVAGLFTNPEQVARFKAEAKAIALLNHEHIVQIFEIGEYEGFPYFALEYLEGGSLLGLCGGKPQRPLWAAQMVHILAQGMAYAHQQGIVHRDLKPANILLADSGPRDALQRSTAPELPAVTVCHPKITDFGLAKLDPNKSGTMDLGAGSQTRTGDVMGTPNYMAPEQAQGRAERVGPAVDIYALGAILYELLTGRPPFGGPTPMDTLLSVVTDEVVPPRRLQPKIPADLETICLKCLRKDPARRYASAADLAADLDRFQTGQSILARPAGLGERLVKWARRRPAVAGLLAVVAVLTIIALVSLSWAAVALQASAETERQGKEQAVTAQREQSQLREQAEQALLTAKRNLYFSRIAQAQLLWEHSDMAKVRKLLLDCPEELRHWEWRHLWSLLRSDLQTVPLQTWVFGMTLSPDGKWLAVNGGNAYGAGRSWENHPAEVIILETQSGRVIQRISNAQIKTLQSLSFSADGQHLLGVEWKGRLHLWSGPDFGRHGTIPPPPQPGEIALAPSGDWAVHVIRNKPLVLWALGTGQVRSWPGGTAPVAQAAGISADGQRLVTLTRDGQAQMWNTHTGQEIRTLPSAVKDPAQVILSPSGRFAVCVTHNSNLQGWDLSTGRSLFTHPMSHAARPVYSPAETHVGFNNNGQVQVWNLQTGEMHRLQPTAAHEVNVVAFSPDNLFAATGSTDRTVRLYDLRSGKELRVYRGHEQGVTGVTFATDGRTLWSADQGGTLKQWDFTREQPYVTTQQGLGLHATFADMVFLPDGTRLLTARGSDALTLNAFATASGVRSSFQKLPVLQEPMYPRNDMVFSGDGRWFAAVIPGQRGAAVWETATGTERMRLPAFPNRVMAVALSKDGARLATAHLIDPQPTATERFGVTLLDVATGKVLRESKLRIQPLSLAFAPDGERLALGMLNTFTQVERPPAERYGPVMLWEADGRLHPLPGPNGVMDAQHVTFSTQGDMVASVGFRQPTNNVLVWDVPTATLRHTLQGPRNLTGVDFSPDGQRLATTGYTGVVTLWDMTTGVDVLTLKLPDQRPLDHGYTGVVTFSPEGRRLAANNFFSRVAFWDAPSFDADAEREQQARQETSRQGAASWHLRIIDAHHDDRIEALPFHLQQLRNLEPLAPTDQLTRIELQLRMGHWAEACAGYAPIFAGKNWNVAEEHWLQYAQVLLLTGNEAEYQRFRAQVLRRALETNPGCRPDWLLQIGVWGRTPLTTTERDVVLRLIASLRDEYPKNAWHGFPLALAELRLGDPAEALRYAAACQRLEPHWLTGGLALVQQALASQRLGRLAEARRLLAEAEQWQLHRREHCKLPQAMPRQLPIHTWLQFVLLHRVARQAQEELERQQP